jgi:predicted GIY-YIG superfamily endonuclease
MATFYIIHSKSTNAFYTGISTNFEMQFEQHKNGHFPKGFKSSATDWVTYFIIHDIEIDTANRIVKHTKKNKSQEYFDSLKADPNTANKLLEEFTNVRSQPDNNHEDAR